MHPDIKFYIRDHNQGAALAIGPGKIALLEAIAQTGSITAAAKHLGMSYRRAWILVDETNRCLVGPAVETAAGGERGGGTSLSAIGVELVRRYRRIERQTQAAAAKNLQSLLRAVPARKRARRRTSTN